MNKNKWNKSKLDQPNLKKVEKVKEYLLLCGVLKLEEIKTLNAVIDKIAEENSIHEFEKIQILNNLPSNDLEFALTIERDHPVVQDEIIERLKKHILPITSAKETKQASEKK